MSRLFKADFKSRQFDAFLARWLSEGLSRGELEEWTRVLTYDSRFREQFADWIKSLREPGAAGPRPEGKS